MGWFKEYSYTMDVYFTTHGSTLWACFLLTLYHCLAGKIQSLLPMLPKKNRICSSSSQQAYTWAPSSTWTWPWSHSNRTYTTWIAWQPTEEHERSLWMNWIWVNSFYFAYYAWCCVCAVIMCLSEVYWSTATTQEILRPGSNRAVMNPMGLINSADWCVITFPSFVFNFLYPLLRHFVKIKSQIQFVTNLINFQFLVALLGKLKAYFGNVK